MRLCFRAGMQAIVWLTLLGGSRGLAATEVPGAASVPAVSAAALPASLPLRRDTASRPAPSPVLPVLGLLGAGGIAGGVWLWRRKGGAPRQRFAGAVHPVLRLSSQALTPHASVHAVQWHDEEFLVACTAQDVRLLARRPAQTSEAGPP